MSDIYVFIVTGILLFGSLAGFVVFFVVTYYKKQQENAKEKNLLQTKFNEDLLTSTIEIQEKAFDDISRELHDNVGQKLSAATIYLNLLLNESNQTNDSKLVSCRDIVSDSLQDIRHISQTLLGEKIAQTGLLHSIQLEISLINKLGISKATLISGSDELQLDPKKEIILFRIIQEAISNATKHAPTSNITITIDKKPEELLISVKDDGVGFEIDYAKADGIGLLNMKRRAQTIGADFRLESQPDKGTTVSIALPF